MKRLAIILGGVAVFVGVHGAAGKPTLGTSFTNSLGMKLVRIEPGEFVMGCGLAPPASEEDWRRRDWDEAPSHKVKISRPLYIAAHEVTNAQYEQFEPRHKKLRGVGGASQGDHEPVTMVTWRQAEDFCRWLSEKENRKYRLPTEAEWEFACRAGTSTAYHTGDALTYQQANIGRSRDGKKKITTVAVGSYPASACGLFDMHGNAREWCLDWYGPYTAAAQVDPVGRADGFVKVVRGGSYDVPSWHDDNARYARSANRSGHLPDDANRCTGFRVVMAEHPRTKPLPAVDPPRFARDVKQTPAPAEGPNPNIPYFDDFRGRRPTIPPDTWGPIFSRWNHFTACCLCPNGDVLACWYTTSSESGRELAQAASRLPAGSNRWQPASLLFDVPDVNDHAPVLLWDGKRVYHFASQSLRGWDDTSVVLRTSDDSGATWTKPRIISRREGTDRLSQSCSAFAAADGTIVLAVDGDGHRRIGLLTSVDRGQTWRLAGEIPESVFEKRAIHPAIAQHKDSSIVAFLRGPDPLPRLVRGAAGGRWEITKTPFGGINVGQKATALRLASGALLLCAADSRKPPLTGQRGTLAALSDDGGKTWPHVRHVEGVSGYLSSAQAPGGTIYLFGSRMTSAALNEAWLRKGKPAHSLLDRHR